MKKSLLLAVICIVVCICLVGCGEEKKPTNSNANSTENVSNNQNNAVTELDVEPATEPASETNTNVDEPLVYDDEIIEIDDEILDIDDTPNAPLQDVVVTNIDDSAKGLVYAYYQKKDAQLTFGDVLTNYTDDFTTLRTGANLQRRVFLGFKLDENDRIQRAFACCIHNGTLFALEGTIDGGKNEANKAIINKYYAGEQIDDLGYRYSVMHAETHAETFENGAVSTFYNGGAQVDRYGKIYCD